MKTIMRIVSICLLLAASAAAGGPPEGPPPAVSVEAVRFLEESEAKTYIGSVMGSETVNVVPRVSGTLQKVAFKEGALVREGDVLFEIEDTVYRATVLVAEALIEQAKADLQLAEKDYERARELLRQKAISTQSYDSALATQKLREARLAEAEANLILARHDLEYCRILSPLDGRIGAKALSEGNYITPATGVLATVVRYQPCKVRFSLSESDFFHYFDSHEAIGNVRLDIVRANGEGYVGTAEMDFVDNLVDRRTDTIDVTLRCDNPDDQLLPGGFVQVRLSERYAAPRLAVPLASVMTDGTNHYVYALADNDVIERRVVVIGDVVGRYQTLASGLGQGDRVLVGGMNKVAPGMTVTPVVVE